MLVHVVFVVVFRTRHGARLQNRESLSAISDIEFSKNISVFTGLEKTNKDSVLFGLTLLYGTLSEAKNNFTYRIK